MGIDDLIKRRNNIALVAENHDDENVAGDCWARLGVANRHIERVLEEVEPFTPGVEREIVQCLDETESWLREVE